MFARLSKPENPPPWSAASAIALVVGLFAALVAGSGIAALLFGESPPALVAGWSLGTILAAVLVFNARRTPEDRAALRIAQTPPRWPLIALLVVGVALAIDLLSLVITGDFWPTPELLGYFVVGDDNALAVRADIDVLAWALAAVFLIVLQPVAEELVFRGVLYPAARAALGPIPGWVTTALAHALLHVLAYTTVFGGFTALWYALAVPFLDALLITAVRADTGSTRAAIVAHAAFGAFAVLKALAIAG